MAYLVFDPMVVNVPRGESWKMDIVTSRITISLSNWSIAKYKCRHVPFKYFCCHRLLLYFGFIVG